MSYFTRNTLSVAGILLIGIQAANAANELVITTGGGTWEAAQKKAYFEPFEKETGIKIVLVPEDHSKLLSSVALGHPEADMTSINAGQLAGFKEHQAVEKIDYKYFSKETLAGIPEALKNEYGVGSVMYSIVIAYNTDEYPASKARPQNWAEFFDTKKFPGPRSVARCEKLVDGGLLEIATMANGNDIKHVYPIDMDRAFAKLTQLKPDVGRWWQSGADAPQSLVNGEVSLAAAYNGRVYGAKQQGAALDLSWNQSLLQYDYWVVMKGSKNYDNAMKFLAYFAQPKPQAVFATEITYGPINKDAYNFIDPELAKWLPGSPTNIDKQLFQDYSWWNTEDAAGQSNWTKAIDRCTKLLSQ